MGFHHSEREDDRGATLVEYALLVAVIALAAVGPLRALNDNTEDRFEESAGDFDSAQPLLAPGTPADDGDGDDADDGSGGDGGDEDGAGGDEDDADTGDGGGTTFVDSSSELHNRNKWTAAATVEVHGTDGQPLTGVSAGLRVRVVTVYRTHDGQLGERSWGTRANLADGLVTFEQGNLNTGANGQEPIEEVRFEVTGIDYYYPSNPEIPWDGVSPSVTVDAP
ncbi:MAG: hypothetical protein U5K30_05245 [Acidimicrobiales bacterium]|nr:hypothetical protein [Acidimicrobiales bacterium]